MPSPQILSKMTSTPLQQILYTFNVTKPTVDSSAHHHLAEDTFPEVKYSPLSMIPDYLLKIIC